jgi:hypothetical protein
VRVGEFCPSLGMGIRWDDPGWMRHGSHHKRTKRLVSVEGRFSTRSVSIRTDACKCIYIIYAIIHSYVGNWIIYLLFA